MRERANEEFKRRLDKRFGVKIVTVDSSKGGTALAFNGNYDRATNTITLDKKATQGEAIYQVALHELTHSAERQIPRVRGRAARDRLRRGQRPPGSGHPRQTGAIQHALCGNAGG